MYMKLLYSLVKHALPPNSSGSQSSVRSILSRRLHRYAIRDDSRPRRFCPLPKRLIQRPPPPRGGRWPSNYALLLVDFCPRRTSSCCPLPSPPVSWRLCPLSGDSLGLGLVPRPCLPLALPPRASLPVVYRPLGCGHLSRTWAPNIPPPLSGQAPLIASGEGYTRRLPVCSEGASSLSS